MGVKGLYSYLKPYSYPINFAKVRPCRIAVDVYPFLYKFKYDMDSCVKLFQEISSVGHQCIFYMDGAPPKEKQEELAQRRQQREKAQQVADALKVLMENKEKVGELDEATKQSLESQIVACEHKSYSIKKEMRELFIERIKAETNIPIVMCEGESDVDLIKVSLKGEVDIVIANDMDLFVAGVERLWYLGKEEEDPLFLEFDRSKITEKEALQSHAWVDIAILAGYEKTMELKRYSIKYAIEEIKKYGCFEKLFQEKPHRLQRAKVEDFVAARRFFTLQPPTLASYITL